ncbi:MAG: hypothetical protein HIU82_10830 [Proteobacteria bacterium]|nr:hypothetical protein [Pseudomonadota bacterium]
MHRSRRCLFFASAIFIFLGDLCLKSQRQNRALPSRLEIFTHGIAFPCSAVASGCNLGLNTEITEEDEIAETASLPAPGSVLRSEWCRACSRFRDGTIRCGRRDTETPWSRNRLRGGFGGYRPNATADALWIRADSRRIKRKQAQMPRAASALQLQCRPAAQTASSGLYRRPAIPLGPFAPVCGHLRSFALSPYLLSAVHRQDSE